MSPSFEQKTKQSVIDESGSWPRSNIESWKFRQQFDDLQPYKQLPHQFQENQAKRPINENIDIKSSNTDKSGLLDRYDNNQKMSKVDKTQTMYGNEKEMDFKINPPVSSSVLPRDIDHNNFFFEPIKSIQQDMNRMERLVHLDFKGAVPSLKYFEEIIPMFKTLGATGLLVEYEDMFPYSGDLEPLKAGNAFTSEQLDRFLQTAQKSNLKVMPLIQTFGHMEFVLKSAFPQLRESSYTPQVIDMTNNSSYKIISAIIQQVLDAHPDASHLHIGCDEVYELGKGASATFMQEKQLTVHQMFLLHAKRVAQLVSSYKAHKVVPVMWDDMLRKIPETDIASSSLSSEVEIMVWHYTPNITGLVGNNNFEKYGRLFKSIWVASSFKGATGSRQFYTEPLYHLRNHISWLKVIEQHGHSLTFKGVALTGWQRYDHFATLCELLPVAMPSLAVCLATLKNAGLTKEIYESTSEILKCDDNIPMTFPEIDNKTKLAIVTQDCSFPGSNVFYAMQALYGYTQLPIQSRLEGWLSDYQVNHGFTSPGQLKVLALTLNKQNNGYTRLAGPLKLHLSSIFSLEDVEEWLEENIYEKKRHNIEILDKVNSLLTRAVWPRRPLPSLKKGKPDVPWQSNLSSANFDQGLGVKRAPGIGEGMGSSEQVRSKLDAKVKYALYKSKAELSQNLKVPSPKENQSERAHLGDSNQQFKLKSEENYEDPERKTNKKVLTQSQRIANINNLLPQSIGSKTAMNRDYNRNVPDIDPSKDNYLRNEVRPNTRNEYRRSKIDEFSPLGKVKESKRDMHNNEEVFSRKNLKPQDNQGAQILKSRVAQSQQSRHQYGSNISPSQTSAYRQQILTGFKKRQPKLGNIDLLDFHDDKMERYEDKLMDNKI